MSVPDDVFVGRRAELAALTGRLADAGVVLVEGPAGVGKTVLLERALRQAGTTAVRGWCPAEPAPPLWPWRSVLRRAGLRLTDGAAAEPSAAASARFAALAGMCDAVLAAGPMVVVLEDLHWADTASLDLLRHVAQEAAGAGIAVLGTVRSPAPEEVALRLAGLSRYGAVTLPLAPFTPGEVAELVGPAVAPGVHAETGGLPLLVAAVRAGHGDLPAVARTLLAALTPDQRELVRAAAVLGEEVDEPLLTAVGGAPGEAVAGALTAAWHAGLLTAAGDGAGYRFAHALVRAEIVAGLAPAQRRRLARRAAQALEAGGGEPAARIAAHWRQAGTGADARRAAADWSRRAAAQAGAAHAHDDAVTHLAGAVADLSTVDVPAAQRAEVLIELARAEYLAGRYEPCLEHCDTAADLAAGAGRGDLVAAGALVLQGVTFPQAAGVLTRLCQRALAYPDLGDALRARVMAQLAVMTADAGRVAQAEAPAREALRLAAVAGDPLAELDAARAREMTLLDAANVPERLRLGELVADRAETLGQPLAAVIGHEWRMQTGYLTGRLDVVESAAAAIEDLAARAPLPVLQWHRHRMLASRAVLAGRFAESVRHSLHATAVAERCGDSTGAVMHFAHGVYLAVLRGDQAALPDGLDAAFAAAPLVPLIDVQRANALALTGSLHECRDVYDRLRATLPVRIDHPAWAGVLVQLTGLVERFDDAATAEAAYRQLLPYRQYPGGLGTATVFFCGSASRHLGQFAAVAGDTAGAVELLREALQRNRAIGARPDTALTLLSLARVLRGRGEPAEAARLTQEALDTAARLDMPGTVAAAGRLSAEIAAERDQADPLTGREREIAALLAQALTNRQIATRLVLSERTVESHVRSILAKTRSANRTEFVARWSAP